MAGNWKKGDLVEVARPNGYTKPSKKSLKQTIYFSANPHINNLNIHLGKTKDDLTRRKYNHLNWKWDPTEHFKKVIDIWDKNWDKKELTVLPKKVNREISKNNTTGNRKIIHYMQPHRPYLFFNDSYKTKGLDKGRKKTKNENIEKDNSYRKDKFYEEVKVLLKQILNKIDKRKQWKIKKIFGGDLTSFQKMIIDIGLRGIKKRYKNNLKIVLKNVNNLVDSLEGKIVITSDHGEAFGEEGEYLHPYNSNNPVLREVPWLEVKDTK